MSVKTGFMKLCKKSGFHEIAVRNLLVTRTHPVPGLSRVIGKRIGIEFPESFGKSLREIKQLYISWGIVQFKIMDGFRFSDFIHADHNRRTFREHKCPKKSKE